MKKQPRKQRAASVTSPWTITGLLLAGHSYRVVKREETARGHIEHREILDDIYGFDVKEGNRPVFHVTFATPPGGDPREAIEYKRALAICTFGAAVQNLLVSAKAADVVDPGGPRA